MAEDQNGTSQIQHGSPASLDLSTLPPIYVFSTHFDTDDLHELEEDLANAGASLTYDIQEAEIVLSKSVKKPRIQFDLRSKGLWTRELKPDEIRNDRDTSYELPERPAKKRRLENAQQAPIDENAVINLVDSSTESESEAVSRNKSKKSSRNNSRMAAQSREAHRPTDSASPEQVSERIVKVVKIEWFTDSRTAGRVRPLDDYISYQGRCVERQPSAEAPQKTHDILQRAEEDSPKSGSKHDRFGRRKFGLNTPSVNPSSWEAGHGANAQYAHLLQETTTEHDGGSSSDLPEMPEWVKKSVKYACQRATPKDNPNDPFLELLKRIKLARLLTNDEIGVRAYSTSIAAIAAYTYKIGNPKEILALPGCDFKIANLWIEYKNTGKIKAVEDLEADEDMKVLRLFYDIWGVGATTAREFYYDKGWRELDDVVEFGWKEITRVQQIGVKYYDEFKELIPRTEVEKIGEVVRQHAVKVRDEGIQLMIVGGYRRGKEASGDVDVILSHPDERATKNLVEDVVSSLEADDWITHTLVLSLNNSERDQQTLPFRAGGGGHGFDTLDKALVVWQDPSWPTKTRDRAENPKAKNPNVHRRVDIIVSPWRTVGCAVVGWSGGTTFERDLRRYAKNVKGWKFDSSGVRDRRNGEVVDIEGYYSWKGWEGVENRAKSMEEAEKRVFEGFGLVYRSPTLRCTG
ncbi:hypothetical protein M409DRAFT_35693 [Zasmidium cellare ATCC 36951]|uniref:DNA polymerase n=1 Tax=Zasmidium cellare ATCC 36951 TaxID=1080233 RepID=A0A6A6CXZ4_ZASCE|nr:uncharacterized protein M409DRAFT_35693 [Zasmidium cellare ATCC 36951]KAF2171915.1 hypothetical protein M409DRAFT_35693 [Zasmidium cellare ATCC 36951]